jgi:AcrR family transcriptional regulator
MPLTRDRVLATAVELADEAGVASVTMRRLAEKVGVEPMSLYYHVPNKEAILDGIVDLVFREVEETSGAFEGGRAGHSAPDSASGPATDSAPGPATEADAAREAAVPDSTWKATLRARILAARRVMLRHPWAPALLDSRTGLGLAQARYVDAVVGTLRSGGLSYDLIHHAMHALGSRMFGFTQELGDEAGSGDAGDSDALAQMAEHVPNLAAMLAVVAHDDPDSTLGWCDDQFEFEFGLDLVLDGLERQHARTG